MQQTKLLIQTLHFHLFSFSSSQPFFFYLVQYRERKNNKTFRPKLSRPKPETSPYRIMHHTADLSNIPIEALIFKRRIVFRFRRTIHGWSASITWLTFCIKDSAFVVFLWDTKRKDCTFKKVHKQKSQDPSLQSEQSIPKGSAVAQW